MPDFFKYFLLDLSKEEAQELFKWMVDNSQSPEYDTLAIIYDQLDVVLRAAD